MSLLLTDGELRATLAAVRGLGEAGIAVTVAAESPASLAGSSRYCARRVVSPSPMREPQAFAAFLRDAMSSGEYEMVWPMADVSLAIAAEVAADPRFAPRFPFPAADVIAAAQDKRNVLETARRLGIACPKEFAVEDAGELPYPVVLKPVRSRYFRDGKWNAATVSYANDAKELRAGYAAATQAGGGCLVQERIEGEGKGVFLLMGEGDVKAAFCHRRLREKPPWGGVSVLSESVAADESLVEASAALLRELGWHGPAMVEFKRERSTGRAVLMEINGRFWGSLQLAIDAGVNFPLLFYRLARGESVDPCTEYRIGVRSRWLLGDLSQFAQRVLHLRKAGQFAGGTLLRSGMDMCFVGGEVRYESPRRGDLAPFRHELRRLAGKKISGRTEPRRAGLASFPEPTGRPARG